MEGQIEFILGGEDNLEDIINLTNECFNENTTLGHATEVYFRNRLDTNPDAYVCGYLPDESGNHTLAAFARLAFIDTPFDGMETYCILNHVCVKPEFRRHHLGTQLLEECERIAAMRNCRDLKLWSKNFRVPAHALYQKYGFKIIDAKFFEKPIERGQNEN